MTDNVMTLLRAADPAVGMPPPDATRRETLRAFILGSDPAEAATVTPPRRATYRTLLAAAILAIALILSAGIVYALVTGWTPSLPGGLAPQDEGVPVPMESASPTPTPDASTGADAAGLTFYTPPPSSTTTLPAVDPAPSTGGWQPQPSGTTQDLEDVYFADLDSGWAVGAGGTILATSDGGVSWRPQRSGADRWLNAVHFVDTARGWVVGMDGLLLTTRDGGASWTKRPLGTDEFLSDVAFADAEHGWIVGSAGTLLATVDGGATWVRQDPGTSTGLVAVAAVDARQAHALGEGNVILTTRDGGTTWARRQIATDALLVRLVFADALHGWALGQTEGGIYSRRALLYATDDGGETWRLRREGTRASDLVDASFSDATHGWAISRRFDDVPNPFLETDDGGATWTVRGTTKGLLWALSSIDRDHAWAVGWGGVVRATANGGVSSDTLSPIAIAKGADGWHRKTVLLKLAAVDPGGSGIVACQYRVDGARHWQRGTRVWVMARRNGVIRVSVRAIDAAGNVAPTQAVKVRFDTREPRTVALEGTVDAEDVGTIRFKIIDPAPCGGWADVIIVAGGTPQLEEAVIARCKGLRTGVWQTLTFNCALPAGTYLFYVQATDAAGNHGGGPTNTLTVKEERGPGDAVKRRGPGTRSQPAGRSCRR